MIKSLHCNVADYFQLLSDSVNDVSINVLFYLDVFGIKKYISDVIFSGSWEKLFAHCVEYFDNMRMKQ